MHLAQQKTSVIVVEKDYVGRHASGVNAGGVRRLGRALPEIPLSVASNEMWRNIEDIVDDDCLFEPSYQVKVAENEEELERQRMRVAQVLKAGFHHEQLVDRETLRDLVPAVSDHCVGAIIVEGDGHANPFRTVQAFKRKAQSYGAEIMEGCPVLSAEHKKGIWHVETSHGEIQAKVIVNCAGAWAGKFAEMLGEPVPIKAVAPMLMITARMPRYITPVVGAEGRTLSFKQFANDTVMVGGGLEGDAYPETNKTVLKHAGLATNARTALDIFPIMKGARIVRCWAGIEGKMSDQIPVIGPSNRENAYHGFGFSAHGFQLGPIGGKILSDLVLNGTTELPIDAFSINRFQT